MLLISLMVAFLSPLTTLVVKSDSVPTINIFKFEFYSPVLQSKTKNLKLRCVADGDPKPEIEFHFHANDASYGKVLKNLSRVVKLDDTAIIIKNISAADAGTYRCYAINKNGRVFKNKKISVDVPGTFNKGAYLKDPATTLSIELGREQEIICPVKSYPHPLHFAWGSQRKGRKHLYIAEDERVHITEKGGLYYSLIRRDDVTKINSAGGISCIMYYDGQPTYSRKYKLNVIKDNVSHIPPTLHVKLTGTTYILEGTKETTIRCIGGGNPVPHITWFKDGVQITNNDSNYRIDPKRPGVLTIKNFHSRLAGNYKCTVQNQVGTVDSDGNVIVARTPTITPFPAMTAAYLGNRLQLRCESKGTIPIRYEWYKNGRVLNSYKTHGARMEISGGKLMISPVVKDTAGSYQCYAINSYGNTYSKTNVYVREPPKPTVERQHDKKATTSPLVIIPTKKSGKEKLTSDDSLQLKYIIIIACSGAVCLVLVSGGICMYCRSKENREKIIYVPPAENGNNNINRNDVIKKELNGYKTDIKQQLLLDLANLPPPPPSLTDQSDDDFSSYGGYKTNHPLYYNDNTMMYLLKHNKDEHLYADIPEDFTRCESDTPSTEL